MSDDPIPSSIVSFVLPENDDFDAMLAAVTGTPHGRRFLQEFARRQRSADVQAMLAAVERIGAAVAQDRIAFADQGARAELRAMAKIIAESRADLPDALPPARVLDDLDHRIGAWLARTAADAELEPPGHIAAPPDGERPAGQASGRTLPACIPSMWEPVPITSPLQGAKNGLDADERDY